jgi:hypothetical protein
LAENEQKTPNTHFKNTHLAENEQKTPKETNYSGDQQKGPKKINKKTKNHHQKDPQTTGLFSITDDENELPRVLAIESCVRVVVSRRLLRKKYKQSEPFF